MAPPQSSILWVCRTLWGGPWNPLAFQLEWSKMSRLTTTEKPFKQWIFWGATFLKGPPWLGGRSHPSKPYLNPVSNSCESRAGLRSYSMVMAWTIHRCLISNIHSYSVCIYADIIWFENRHILYTFILYLHTFIFVKREISLYSNPHTHMPFLKRPHSLFTKCRRRADPKVALISKEGGWEAGNEMSGTSVFV